MNKNPLVSVIIPAYNVEKYIEEAINSVLSQTYLNIEIIVVDDGSIDNTKRLVDHYLGKNRIIYLFQNNKGLSGARNTGIKVARGEYIALLDADDLFLPTKIEKQVSFMENNKDCDFCYCDVNFFIDGKPEKILKSHYKYYSGNIFKYLIKGSFVNPSTLFFKKQTSDIFGVFDESFKRAEDLEYYLRVSLLGAKFCFVDELLFLSRIRKSGNFQSDYVLMQSSILKIFENVKLKLSPEKIKEYSLNNIINKRKSKLALVYLINGDRKSCRNILKTIQVFNLFRIAIYLLSILPKFILKSFVKKLIIIKRSFLYK
jgi:glycosyltransferase involved in cell wall biosynthesis